MAEILALMTRFPRPGRLDWIGVRARRRGPLLVVEGVLARAGIGLAGDHYVPGAKASRQVTLIQAEHLPVVAALCGRQELDPGLLRRNLLVSGINLAALKGMRFRVGAALLEGTETCHPCSRMEEVLGPGGYNAMRGHGGLCARVIEGGRLRVGDPVAALEPAVDFSAASDLGVF
jgi:MOSC domain-containing protein YiiM